MRVKIFSLSLSQFLIWKFFTLSSFREFWHWHVRTNHWENEEIPYNPRCNKHYIKWEISSSFPSVTFCRFDWENVKRQARVKFPHNPQILKVKFIKWIRNIFTIVSEEKNKGGRWQERHFVCFIEWDNSRCVYLSKVIGYLLIGRENKVKNDLFID